MTGCDKKIVEHVFISQYIYTNNSGHPIVMEKWFRNQKSEYSLPVDGVMNFEMQFNFGGCFIDGVHQMLNSECLLFEADSIKIRFDNQKVLNLTPNNRAGNLFMESNYECERPGSNRKVCRYSFTEQDYNSAD